MFKAPFSFSGRITRREYLFTCVGLFFACVLGGVFMDTRGAGEAIGAIIILVSLWIAIAQGWKRSQDAGWHGIISIIPYVNMALLFASGDQGSNAHGPNPRLSAAETAAAAAPSQPSYTPPPLPDAWERARSDPAPKLQTSSFKCTSCGAQNTNVVYSGSACCQYCGAPKG
jgi:uncharacterized membrane protein YhaH (DUF805 family)